MVETMVETSRDDVTRLLQAIGRGEYGANDELLERVYAELHSIALAEIGGKRNQTLEATALVHEAYLRLLDRDASTWENRRNFFFAVSRAMHDILVEQARRRASLKRGRGWQRSKAEDWALAIETPEVDLLALEEGLERLRADDPRLYEIVQLRFFGGLTSKETAEVLGISERTVKRDWRFIRARLYRELAGGESASGLPPD